jgi:hypothetical protein
MDALGTVRSDGQEAALWLEDYWRVVAESEAAEAAGLADGTSELLEAPEPDLLDTLLAPPGGGLLHDGDDGEDECDDDAGGFHYPETGVAHDADDGGLSLSPGFVVQAEQAAAGQVTAILAGVSPGVRLAVYQALLGPRDDSYPDAWLDPETGELPALRQLAGLDGISMPTLRKRRNDAMARLRQAAAGAMERDGHE